MMQVPLSSPDITELEKNAVLEVLNTAQLSLGPKLPAFEQAVAAYTGVKYAVAVNSGTSALHLIVRALGIGEGDLVITTPFSFIASSNCFLFEKAIPVFVDIEPQTYNLDPVKVKTKIKELKEQGQKVKAILAVDVFGHPADWAELEKIAQEEDLFLIDDSCEAIGASYTSQGQTKKAGSFGDAGCFAFYPNKQITTGEGGIITTNKQNIYDLALSMRNQGRAVMGSAWLGHERLGYNYRLSDINCALGLAQMQRLPEILAKRQKVANYYLEQLQDVPGLNLPYIAPNVEISWFVFVVRLADQYTQQDRDQIMQKLRTQGVQCNNYFVPIHYQPFYQQLFGYQEGDFPITEQIAQRTIALPFFSNMTNAQIDYVVATLKNAL